MASLGLTGSRTTPLHLTWRAGPRAIEVGYRGSRKGLESGRSHMPRRGVAWLACLLLGWGSSLAAAQPEGGLYVADSSFTFEVAAKRALAQNPRGARFFLLALPPQTAALRTAATGPVATLRQQVVAANGVLLVCQRDIDAGRVDAASLVPGVVAVRGWPPKGSSELPPGQRYFPGENPAQLPAADEALRRLRSSCS